MSINKPVVFFAFACASLPFATSAATLNAPKYDALKRDFLAVDPGYFAAIDASELASLPVSALEDASNPLGFKINELGTMGWYTYGGNYFCGDGEEVKSICRFSTGGSPQNRGDVCGQSVNNDYEFAKNTPDNHCSSEAGIVPWSGNRIWLGTKSPTDYIENLFADQGRFPINRLCVEFELPADRLQYQAKEFASKPALSQLVNPQVADQNLAHLRIEWGTYTAPYNSSNNSADKELGGTFHGPDAHFYHKPTLYGRYPNDLVYALDSNTFVACMGENPSGVRSGARPPFNINPLMTVVGSTDGVTDGYLYGNYLTRVYMDILGMGFANAQYPLTVKYNKFWIMYEKNDIAAVSGSGETMGVSATTSGGSVDYPFTLFNSATSDREYRVTLMDGNNLAVERSSGVISLFVDANNNKKLDSGEVEIKANQLITLKGNQNMSFIARHTPDFSHQYVYTVNGLKGAFASINFKENGRMRSTGYAIRTWQLSAEELAQKDSILKGLYYHSADSLYKLNAQWNHQKANNYRLIRNSPDFVQALNSLQSGPGEPTSFQLQFR